MIELTISGEEIIFDGSQVMQAYYSIDVSNGLYRNNNIISIKDEVLNSNSSLNVEGVLFTNTIYGQETNKNDLSFSELFDLSGDVFHTAENIFISKDNSYNVYISGSKTMEISGNSISIDNEFVIIGRKDETGVVFSGGSQYNKNKNGAVIVYYNNFDNSFTILPEDLTIENLEFGQQVSISNKKLCISDSSNIHIYDLNNEFTFKDTNPDGLGMIVGDSYNLHSLTDISNIPSPYSFEIHKGDELIIEKFDISSSDILSGIPNTLSIDRDNNVLTFKIKVNSFDYDSSSTYMIFEMGGIDVGSSIYIHEKKLFACFKNYDNSIDNLANPIELFDSNDNPLYKNDVTILIEVRIINNNLQLFTNIEGTVVISNVIDDLANVYSTFQIVSDYLNGLGYTLTDMNKIIPPYIERDGYYYPRLYGADNLNGSITKTLPNFYGELEINYGGGNPNNGFVRIYLDDILQDTATQTEQDKTLKINFTPNQVLKIQETNHGAIIIYHIITRPINNYVIVSKNETIDKPMNYTNITFKTYDYINSDNINFQNNILSFTTSESNNHINIINTETDLSTNIVHSNVSDNMELVLSKDGSTVAYQDYPNIVVVKDLFDTKSKELFNYNVSDEVSISLNSDGTLLAFGNSGDLPLQLYQYINNSWIKIVNDLNQSVFHLEFKDNKLYAGYSGKVNESDVEQLGKDLIIDVNDLQKNNIDISNLIPNLEDISLNLDTENERYTDISERMLQNNNGFCVSCSEKIVDLLDDQVIPFDDISSTNLFSDNFDTTTYSYTIPKGGKYLIGWNCYINNSSPLYNYDFTSFSNSLISNNVLDLSEYQDQNPIIVNNPSEIRSGPSLNSSGYYINFNYPTGNSGPSNWRQARDYCGIRKKLPDIYGTVKLKAINPSMAGRYSRNGLNGWGDGGSLWYDQHATPQVECLIMTTDPSVSINNSLYNNSHYQMVIDGVTYHAMKRNSWSANNPKPRSGSYLMYEEDFPPNSYIVLCAFGDHAVPGGHKYTDDGTFRGRSDAGGQQLEIEYLRIYQYNETTTSSIPPIIMLQKKKNNTSSYTTILKGGNMNKKNETRQIITRLNVNDQLRLSLTGQFTIQGDKSIFYGFPLFHNGNRERNYGNTYNLNLETLDISKYMITRKKISTYKLKTLNDINIKENMIIKNLTVNDTIKNPFYGFQVTCIDNTILSDKILPFNDISGDNYFCYPNHDYNNNGYTVPNNGIYEFGFQLYLESLVDYAITTPNQHTGHSIHIYKNNDIVFSTGDYDFNLSCHKTIVNCKKGDRIYLKCNDVSKINFAIDLTKSSFYGFLFNLL